MGNSSSAPLGACCLSELLARSKLGKHFFPSQPPALGLSFLCGWPHSHSHSHEEMATRGSRLIPSGYPIRKEPFLEFLLWSSRCGAVETNLPSIQ